jgi:hypothetical protein
LREAGLRFKRRVATITDTPNFVIVNYSYRTSETCSSRLVTAAALAIPDLAALIFSTWLQEKGVRAYVSVVAPFIESISYSVGSNIDDLKRGISIPRKPKAWQSLAYAKKLFLDAAPKLTSTWHEIPTVPQNSHINRRLTGYVALLHQARVRFVEKTK